MPTLRKFLPFICFFAGGIFLLRGVRILISSASAALADIPGSAYEHGYVLGEMAASILFIAAAAGFLLLGWRRLRALRSQ